jgi:S-(hydroxymethyl)glutathione dehydrogenase / alcohol dehydrogenase
MQIEAAVFRKVHEPLTIETVDIDKPQPREVLVRTVATGVCHSDLHVIDGVGRVPLDRPIVLGHEGAGIVEAVGADVTSMRVGDHVVACLSGFCGGCPQCLSGHPNLCTGNLVARPETAPPRLSQQGQPVRQFIAISSYAEKMLLHENSLVRIDPELPLDRACLIGCGVLTGVGAALASRRGRQWRYSAAAASGCRSCRGRGSAARAKSSPSTCLRRRRRWQNAPVRPISSIPPRKTR